MRFILDLVHMNDKGIQHRESVRDPIRKVDLIVIVLEFVLERKTRARLSIVQTLEAAPMI